VHADVRRLPLRALEFVRMQRVPVRGVLRAVQRLHRSWSPGAAELCFNGGESGFSPLCAALRGRRRLPGRDGAVHAPRWQRVLSPVDETGVLRVARGDGLL